MLGEEGRTHSRMFCTLHDVQGVRLEVSVGEWEDIGPLVENYL